MAEMNGRRRRPRGAGCVFKYRTKAGAERYGIKFDEASADGRCRQVMRRRDENGAHWLTREDALIALREAIRASGAPPGSPRSWACLVPDCFARSVTKAPVLLCADHRDLLLAQHGKTKAHDPVVYFLRNGNRVKIGWTTNLRGRVSSLSLSLSLPMSAVLATVPGGPAEETGMHGRFASAHIEHEWFEFTPDIEAFVGTLVTERPV
jgi:hypothetical protein